MPNYIKEQMRICNCKICIRSREIDKVLKSGTKKQLRELVQALLNDLMHAEDDSDYFKCILDGSWPSSVNILSESLQTARQLEFFEELGLAN